jgi:two-component system, sensor histidine kinase
MGSGEPIGSVLLIEDEYDSAQMIAKILTYYGIEVRVARGASEGLTLLTHYHPALIVTDLAMPGMDGWELLSAVRSNLLLRHIPVVAITAYHSFQVEQEATHFGFNGYFPKPVNPRTFAHALITLVQAHTGY